MSKQDPQSWDVIDVGSVDTVFPKDGETEAQSVNNNIVQTSITPTTSVELTQVNGGTAAFTTLIIGNKADDKYFEWFQGNVTIKATNINISSSDQRISAGSGNDIVIMDADDATYRLWAGNATAASAPFSVTKAGVLNATGATISGTVTANSGAIGGWDIGATTLSSGTTNIILDSGNKKITINNSTFGNSGIQLDYNAGTPRAYIGDGSNAYFQYDGTKITWKASNTELDVSGNLTATSVDLTGAIKATSGYFAGSITLGDGSTTNGQITFNHTDTAGDSYIASGKTDFTNVASGFILGVDDSDSNLAKFYIGDSSKYFNWDGTDIVISAGIFNTGNMINALNLGDGSSNSGRITLNHAANQGDTYIAAGKSDFTTTDDGFIIGVDDSDGDTVKMYLGSSTKYLYWDGTDLVVAGDIIEIDTSTGKIKGDLGSVVQMTYGETIDGTTTPVVVYQSKDDGEVYKADASHNDERSYGVLGFANSSSTDGNTGGVQVGGSITVPAQTLTVSVSETSDQYCIDSAIYDYNMFTISSTNDQVSQAFMVGDQVSNITSIKFSISSGSGSPTAQVNIYAVDANLKPTGSSLASSAAISVSTTGIKTFTLTSALDVKPGDIYCAVLSSSDADASNIFTIRGSAASSNGYRFVIPGIDIADSSYFTTYSTTDGGSTWAEEYSVYFITFYDEKEYTYGDPVFLSETAGEFTFNRPTASGSTVQKIAKLLNSTTFLIEPRQRRFIGSASGGLTTTNTGGTLYFGAPPRAEEAILQLFVVSSAGDYYATDLILTKGEKTLAFLLGSTGGGDTIAVCGAWTDNMIRVILDASSALGDIDTAPIASLYNNNRTMIYFYT